MRSKKGALISHRGVRLSNFGGISRADQGGVDPGLLQQQTISRIPRTEDGNQRTYYGRGLNLSRIETAIRNAHNGRMRDITDLGRETLSLDGHASSVLQKRLNRVAAMPWRVDPAEGDGVDKAIATDYAQHVRQELSLIPHFRQSLLDLAWAAYDGRAVLEIEWMNVGGDWPMRVADLHWIHPRRVSFGQQRDLRLVESNQEVTGFRDIGIRFDDFPNKFVTHAPKLFGDYQEREGLNPRILYWSFFSRFGTRERLILMELFGKPWRIITQNNPDVPSNDEDLDKAFDQIDGLGATSTARLPRGMDIEIAQQQKGAGDVHEQTIQHAQEIISKLVLGGTLSTDAQSTGLGSNLGETQKSGEDLIVEGDAQAVAESITEELVRAMITVNRGEHALINAPNFFIEPELGRNPKEEIENIAAATSVGIPVALEEAQDRAGYRAIEESEPYLISFQPEAQFGQPASAPRTAIVFAPGSVPPVGSIMADPTSSIGIPGVVDTDPDAPPGDIVPPNAAPALPDPPLEEGQSAIEELSLSDARSLAAKMNEHGIERCRHQRSNSCPICRVERVNDAVELDDAGEATWAVQWRAKGDTVKAVEPPEDPDEDDPKEIDSIITASALNLETAAACPHGRKRKCKDCGVQRSRPTQPWRDI